MMAPDLFAARFWARVDTSGGPSACWPWLGYVDRKGMGRVYDGGGRERGRSVAVPRMAHILVSGEEVPPGVVIRTWCFDGACANPLHGYRDDCANGWRRQMAGTATRGEANAKARLSEGQVREIRELHRAGYGLTELARCYGIVQGTVWFVVTGKHWRHVE